MAAPGDRSRPEDDCIFGRQFNIPSIKSDLSRWDKAWEKALRDLSASEDVYSTLKVLWKRDALDDLPSATERLNKRVRELQDLLITLWDQVGESGEFVLRWVLLDEAEKKRHLLNGLKQACESSSLLEEARAMCPEITTSAMLKKAGSAFADFAHGFLQGIKQTDPSQVYFLPCQWWQSAVDDMPKPWPEDVTFTFTQLSVQRNEFISEHLTLLPAYISC